ncbi:MAG: hypothetical protein H8E44_17880 [Planctomycetes bacterium]|nr:hypothetical protein [Planctomycetota bacterium]MBL7037619.1 hypothetical protein [Pirellulaceae bacterium]
MKRQYAIPFLLVAAIILCVAHLTVTGYLLCDEMCAVTTSVMAGRGQGDVDQRKNTKLAGQLLQESAADAHPLLTNESRSKVTVEAGMAGEEAAKMLAALEELRTSTKLCQPLVQSSGSLTQTHLDKLTNARKSLGNQDTGARNEWLIAALDSQIEFLGTVVELRKQLNTARSLFDEEDWPAAIKACQEYDKSFHDTVSEEDRLLIEGDVRLRDRLEEIAVAFSEGQTSLAERIRRAILVFESRHDEETRILLRSKLPQWIRDISARKVPHDTPRQLQEAVGTEHRNVVVGFFEKVGSDKYRFREKLTSKETWEIARSRIRYGPEEPMFKKAVDEFNRAAESLDLDFWNRESWKAFCDRCEQLDADVAPFRKVAMEGMAGREAFEQGVWPEEYRRVYVDLSFRTEADASRAVWASFDTISVIVNNELRQVGSSE